MENYRNFQRILVVRPFSPADVVQCRRIAGESTMTTFNRTFLSALFRETTFQLMIFCSAILFIIVGVPFNYCALSVPLTVVIIYLATWSAKMLKSLEIQQEFSLVKQQYQQSDKTNLLVAEYYGPMIDFDQNAPICFMDQNDLQGCQNQLSSMRVEIVGYIGFIRSKEKACCSWLKRLAVAKDFQRKGIATHLVNKASQFCYEKGYSAIETCVTECQHEGREFLLRGGFELEQVYHKNVLGSTANYSKCLLRKDLLHSKSAFNA